MDLLVTVHVAAAVVLLILAVVVGVWGLARARAIGTQGRPREARGFAQLLQLSHTAVLATGIVGLAVLAGGSSPDDPLHARVYGPFMVVAIIAAYGYRTQDARANIRVFAIASLVIAALALRAVFTG